MIFRIINIHILFVTYYKCVYIDIFNNNDKH